MKTCENCHYWKSIAPHLGTCHRNPSPNQTYNTHWCGEWEETEEARRKRLEAIIEAQSQYWKRSMEIEKECRDKMEATMKAEVDKWRDQMKERQEKGFLYRLLNPAPPRPYAYRTDL